MGRPVRVLVLSNSALAREILSDTLSPDPEFNVAGSTFGAAITLRKVERFSPDLLLVDLDSEGADRLPTLQGLAPIIAISNRAPDPRQRLTLSALGVLEIIYRPEIAWDQGGAWVGALWATLKKVGGRGSPAPDPATAPAMPTARAVAIGASTGGIQALSAVLRQLPGDFPPVVIALHIPASFSGQFANQLDAECALQVQEAWQDAPLQRGSVYIAPGDLHLRVRRSRLQLRCELDAGPKISFHRPSVDVLFRSVAEAVGAGAVGVLLTGMGKDGAAGLKAMRDQGAFTIAQDEHTSAVWGMPREAILLGGACEILPLASISERLLQRESSAGVDVRGQKNSQENSPFSR